MGTGSERSEVPVPFFQKRESKMGTGSERSEVPVPFFDGDAAFRPGKGTGASR